MISKKKEQKTLTELLEQDYILSPDEASHIDEHLRSYIIVNPDEFQKELLEKMLYKQLLNTARYKNGITKNVIKKFPNTIKQYLEQNKLWIFFEGIMCMVAYGMTIISMINEIIAYYIHEYDEILSNSVLFISCILLVIFALIINHFQKSNLRLQLIVDIFNRYSPTIIIITTIFYYLIKLCKATYFLSVLIIISLAFLLYVMIYKYVRFSKVLYK